MMKEFAKKVLTLVKKIPKGKVSTYSAIAHALGNPKLARAVGNALNKNRDLSIKCFKVVRADGKLGGYRLGIKFKKELLKKEGIKIKHNKIDLEKYFYEF